MSARRAGPELPPHLLAKRKWQAEANAIPELQSSKARTKSPSSSPDSTSKRRRVIGPAPPPAPLSERPPGHPNLEDETSDEDDEDDFGPSLPSRGKPIPELGTSTPYRLTNAEHEKMANTSRRDDWMTMPPKQDDLAARLDPTKQRARGFNTGKSAKGPNQSSGVDNTMWTETPEQKRKRLEDEILGVSQPTVNSKDDHHTRKTHAEDEEKARKIQEYNEKHRSKSLYEQHKGSATKEKEDDPSKRGFDYEKDMAIGAKIGHAQKQELLTKAADFGSRFSKGSYL